MSILIKDKVQSEALLAVQSANYRCSVLASVGFGKTLLQWLIIKQMLEDGLLQPGARVLFQTCSRFLLDDFVQEHNLLLDKTGVNVIDQINLTVATYHSKKLNHFTYDLVLNDEVDMTGPVLREPLTKHTGYCVNVTGTVSHRREFSKLNWLEKNWPICYRMPLEDAIAKGLITDFETFVTYRTLSNQSYKKLFKNGKVLSEKDFYQYAWYYYEKNRTQFTLLSQAEADPKYTLTTAEEKSLKSHKYLMEKYQRAYLQLLYNMPSRIFPIKKYLSNLDPPTILWARTLKYLDTILGSKKVCRSQEHIDKFNQGLLPVMGTVKAFSRGKTPKAVNNLLMCGPIGSPEDFEQLLGRIIRPEKNNPNKVAKLHIFITLDTQEEVWFNKCRRTSFGVLNLRIK